ncbi:MAG: putative rRNA methyltransferase, partial [Friedmanniella sp.]|nr:putative rRNA methyltransferase [Friedmanniella sp.]
AYRDAGLSLVCLDGSAEVSIADLPQASGPLVLIIGSEGDGLSRLVKEACETLASIPITASIESLNAGVAAGIALYEISRHRA